MNEQAIVSKMHEYLHMATKELCAWLCKMLPRVSEDWWQVCVMDNLSFVQRQYAEENGYSRLEDLDLAALLRVADKSWYDMRSFAYLPSGVRQSVRDMMKVRKAILYHNPEILKKLPVDHKGYELYSVEEVKGMEFETVFVILDGMSENELYISYTRALNKLFITII